MSVVRKIRRVMGRGLSLIPGSSTRVFTSIYNYRLWEDGETASGDGSTLQQTERVRALLPALLRKYDVKTLLDAPCGDFHWMKELRLVEDGLIDRYMGTDVVHEIIEGARSRYAIPGRAEFFVSDLSKGPLPSVDLVLCRDCLVHLPLDVAVKVISSFKASGSRFLLSTHYPGLLKANKNIRMGNWRPLDLTLPPFSLPAPVEVINEGCSEARDFPQKSLGLWRLDDVPSLG